MIEQDSNKNSTPIESFSAQINMELEQREPSGILSIARELIFKDILSIDPGYGRWKILILDDFALNIVNTAVQMGELLDHNITLVEPFEKLRKPYQKLEAIYIIRPSKDGIRRIIEDFSNSHNSNGRLYSAAHVFFLSEPDHTDMQTLNCSVAHGFLKTMRSIPLDYLPLESNVFSLDRRHSLITFYGSNVLKEQKDTERHSIAEQIASTFQALGKIPNIRYSRSETSTKTTGRLAVQVRSILERCITSESGDLEYDGETELLIVDRTVDLVAPLLHEFTYQAMAKDLLQFSEENENKFQYRPDKGSEKVEHEINERTDFIWSDIRHLHIAEAIEGILDSFRRFLTESPAAIANNASNQDGQQQVADIAHLKEILASLTDFTELKKQFSAHINMTQECMRKFKSKYLDRIAAVEQDLATGTTTDGKPVKDIERAILPIVSSSKISINDKLRLLMIYLLKHGVVDESGKELFAAARLDSFSKEVIRNLTLLGVELRAGKARRKSMELRSKKQRKIRGALNQDEEDIFELSRYVPHVKEIAEDLIEGNIDDEIFPLLPLRIERRKKSIDSGFASLGDNDDDKHFHLKSRPTWHIIEDGSAIEHAVTKPTLRRKIIIFIIGGVTYSEMRSAYEISEKYGVDMLIGSTHIITPNDMIKDLYNLNKPLMLPAPVAIPFSEEEEKEIEKQATLRHDSNIVTEKGKLRRIRKFAGKMLRQVPEAGVFLLRKQGRKIKKIPQMLKIMK